jgi:indole-3-glycerol phosphate synthase
LIDTVPDILARIVARKREELASARSASGELALRAECILSQRRDFRAALRCNSPAIIAEIKKASPSRGVLAEDFNPVRTAGEYELGGAAALSVLTDETFFQGSLTDLEGARQATRLPVLRKDFTLEEFHVLEAAAHGADAILLIAAILDDYQIRHLREFAARWDIAALVEVHDETELDRAFASGAQLIGVNNRNLTTFEVTLETSLRLAERIPTGILRVSESGIHSAEDIRVLQGAGYQAFLVGEHLMQAPSAEAALRDLVTPA